MDSAGAAEELNLRRFFCEQLPDGEGPHELGAEALRHAGVLRLALGERVVLFDGLGARVVAEIAHLDRKRLACRLCGPVQRRPRGAQVVLLQAVPKGSHAEDIVRMTTELGVSQIHFMLTERCVARWKPDPGRLARLRRIAIEAARQSEQDYVPELFEAAPLTEVVKRPPENTARFALLERSGARFTLADKSRVLWLAVGPEGGFSSIDRAALSEAGFMPAGLGRSILRTETAAVVGVALGIDRLEQAD